MGPTPAREAAAAGTRRRWGGASTARRASVRHDAVAAVGEEEAAVGEEEADVD